MAKHKSPSVLNSRIVRINLADYQLLKSLSQAASVSMAESLHKIITRDWAMAHKDKPVTQPAFRVTAPAAYRSGPITALATNGSKAVAFRIKSKGVRRE